MANAKEPPEPKPTRRHTLGESLTLGEAEVESFLELTAEVAKEAEFELERIDRAKRKRGSHAAGSGG
jgi:hypothetical protein